MKILIIEDDEFAGDRLKKKVNEFYKSKCHIVGPLETFQSAIEFLGHWTPDIALIDISLRNNPVGGINLASVLQEFHTTPIIFVTARKNESIAQETSKIDYCDFLMKPWGSESLNMALTKAEKSINTKYKEKHRAFLMPNRNDLFWARNIEGGYESIPFDDIVMIKPSPPHRQEVIIYNREKLEITATLKEGLFNQHFGIYDDFFLVGRKYIINRKYVRKIWSDKLEIERSVDESITLIIPRDWKPQVLKWLGIRGNLPLTSE